MAAKITAKFPQSQIELIPGGRGDFIVTVNDRVVWHKKQADNQFPDEVALVDGLRSG